MTVVHKLRRNIRDYGWRVTLEKAITGAIAPIYFHQVYRIYRVNVADAKFPPAFSNRGSKQEFKIKYITSQDVQEIAQIESMAEWLRGAVASLIDAGQMCLVALDGEAVASFILINFESMVAPLVNKTGKLPAHSAWLEHIAVNPDYRGEGLSHRIIQAAFVKLKERRILRCYAGIHHTNLASQRMVKSIGFKPIVDLHYKKTFTLEQWYQTRMNLRQPL